MELRLIAREARHRDKKKPKYPHTNHKSASSTRRALMQVVLIVLLKLCAPSHDAHPQTARSTSFFTHHLRLISLAVVVGKRRPPRSPSPSGALLWSQETAFLWLCWLCGAPLAVAS